MTTDCNNSTSVHLLAGGVAGTTAAIATCPLEVVKTRLQSSAAVFQPIEYTSVISGNLRVAGCSSSLVDVECARPAGILGCIRHIVKTEGVSALYKGLGPNIIGVAPARAIYFAIYAKTSKKIVKQGVDRDSKLVPIGAGAAAGFSTHTVTSPVWFVKTRLQLNSASRRYSMKKVVARVYRTEGIKGFYRGLSASYWGVTETIIHFVIYEHIKKAFRELRNKAVLDVENNIEDGDHNSEKNASTDFMIAAGVSKTFASIVAYPHEVARTRLRQEEHSGPRKYRSFWQTLILVYNEEGRRGLYGGLGTQLVRQVPNSAIMFMIYELVVALVCQDT